MCSPGTGAEAFDVDVGGPADHRAKHLGAVHARLNDLSCFTCRLVMMRDIRKENEPLRGCSLRLCSSSGGGGGGGGIPAVVFTSSLFFSFQSRTPPDHECAAMLADTDALPYHLLVQAFNIRNGRLRALGPR